MIARKHHLDGLAVGLLLACSMFWGFQQVLVKATLPELPPVFQAALRFAGASAVLMLWCRWRGLPLFQHDGALWPGLLAGALFATEFACLYLALQFAPASRVTVFQYTAPFWVAAVLPFFISSEKLRPLQWLGLFLAFAAIVFSLREAWSTSSPARQWLGDLLALSAGTLWGLTTVVMRSSKLMQVSPEKLLFYQVAVSALTLPALSLALGERWVWQFSAFAGVSLFAQTVIGAFASFLTWMWMLGRYPATKISVFVFLTPVFSLLFATLWLHEAVSSTLLISLAMVAAGIVLVNLKPAE